ncbi:MAG: hypothetical protein II943_04925 [Victivallales bacterium]|nr:hypothetical protein [Victivallales bacterium]
MEIDFLAFDWEWIYSSTATSSELDGKLPALLKSARQIKQNPGRKVFCTDAYFIKVYFHDGRHLNKEWKCAQLAQEKGIPVVEHLAYGRSSAGEILVTRALEGAISVKEWLTAREFTEVDMSQITQLAERYANFVCRVVKAGVFHPDFHSGNILLVPSSGKLCLVDVSGIRRSKFTDRPQLWRMYRSLLEFRHFFAKEQIIRLLGIAGASDGAKMWREIQLKSTRHLLVSWRKRSWQMLNPPSRYTVRDGDWLRFVDGFGKPLPLDNSIEAQASSVESARKRCLADFLLERINIPHQRILAWKEGTAEMLVEAVDAHEITQAPEEYLERLGFLGIRPPLQRWAALANGDVLMKDLAEVMDFPMLDIASMRGPFKRAYSVIKTRLGLFFS